MSFISAPWSPLLSGEVHTPFTAETLATKMLNLPVAPEKMRETRIDKCDEENVKRVLNMPDGKPTLPFSHSSRNKYVDLLLDFLVCLSSNEVNMKVRKGHA